MASYPPVDLPPGLLTGHYALDGQLYTAHSATPSLVLNPRVPEQAPPVDSSTTKIPKFREMRYITPRYCYLMFVPIRNPWRTRVLNCLDYAKHKLPIVFTEGEGWHLALDLADRWLDLEVSLRELGRALFLAAPYQYIPWAASSFFFPSRFKFIAKFRTEQAARFAAWLSIENFLPLVGYVVMGVWMMQWREDEEGQSAQDWRTVAADRANVDRTFLDYVENELCDWREQRVGGLYQMRIGDPHHLLSGERMVVEDDRRTHTELETILMQLMMVTFPIPIVLSWGPLPPQFSPLDVPQPFHAYIPAAEELCDLAKDTGRLNFSRWDVCRDGSWVRNPYVPPSPLPIAASPPFPAEPAFSPRPDDTRATQGSAPFPSLPRHSQQRTNESIEAFFARRRKGDKTLLAAETPKARQSRKSRTAHAKQGGILPKKTGVFVWENEGGHYIRHRQDRAIVDEIWRDFTPSQRRYDPFRNEWDLCTLFENGEPVFGDAYATARGKDSDDDDDDYDEAMTIDHDDAMTIDHDDAMTIDHPTFPPNVDWNAMASLAAQGGTQTELPGSAPQSEEVVDDYLSEVDDVPNLTESEIPVRDPRQSSRSLVTTLFAKYGADRRTDTVYEPVGSNLLDALRQRYGFVLPSSPDTFVARETYQPLKNASRLTHIAGLPDDEASWASVPGLANVMKIFFGQCIKARYVNDIDKTLLDFHIHGPPSTIWDIRREHLTSMLDPMNSSYYYVLRKKGAGLGESAILFPSATDVLEVIRRGLGDMGDIIKFLLGRGMKFWFAQISADIMPAGKTTPHRRRRNAGSGIGFRSQSHTFNVEDHNAYLVQLDAQLLHINRAAIALQYGGVIARLARPEVSDDQFVANITDIDHYDVGDCLWDQTSKHSYWHLCLSDPEIELLCGVYDRATDQPNKNIKNTEDGQTAQVSFWPRPHSWARGNLEGAWWTPQCETWFQKRMSQLTSGGEFPSMPNGSQWRNNLKFSKEVGDIWKGYEEVATGIMKKIISNPTLAACVPFTNETIRVAQKCKMQNAWILSSKRKYSLMELARTEPQGRLVAKIRKVIINALMSRLYDTPLPTKSFDANGNRGESHEKDGLKVKALKCHFFRLGGKMHHLLIVRA
ncbi:hypothetical protein C8F04DRAFT_1179545 [Mycena alexandri]|uniref:Uncharacterized protein n=1 Tax=Mycena alexandri TaxID=1745969 RepID=A0AAD6X868_9AGAR|nr:hypothetical protein C8F04DRAFT_1179545 [Mycena alexandri]